MRRMASSSSSMWTTNKRCQRVSLPLMASRASSFRLASTTFKKGSKKASAACSNVIPAVCSGFSRALFSSQMNVMPCKTKRVSIVGILAERYIQRQYREVGVRHEIPKIKDGPTTTVEAERRASDVGSQLPGRAGGYPPGPPTDPYVRDARIRFLRQSGCCPSTVHWPSVVRGGELYVSSLSL